MRECDMYPALRDWLQAQNYTVYVERFGCDVVAVRDGKLTVIELKLCMSRGLLLQAADRAIWADYVFVAVASRPRSLDECASRGFGVLRVGAASVTVLAEPHIQPTPDRRKRAYRVKRLAKATPAALHHLAGLPAGPRLRRQRMGIVPTVITVPRMRIEDVPF